MSLKTGRVVVVLLGALLAFSLGRMSSSWELVNLFSENNSTQKTKRLAPDLLAKIKAKNSLEVIMVNGPTTYFEGAMGREGFEYILMQKFAEYLGVELKLHVVSTVNEALQLTENGQGEVTSGALSKTKQRTEDFVFGPSYFSVKEQVVCHQKMIRRHAFPRSVADLVGLDIIVGKGTSYEQTLKALQAELPKLSFKVLDQSSEDLLRMIDDGKADCSVVDSNIFAVNNRYFPALRKAFSVSETKELAWILREDEDRLNAALDEWLNSLERSGEMARLVDHYYSYTNSFNYVNLTAFHKRLKSRLPKYKKIFMQAGEKYNFPWTMLAAQSYQESHWDRLAKSPTGVRGMMMLTLPTAKEMGVKYRLNATQSINGGAKYFSKVLKRISDDVKGVDRYKFAYAAYNVGMGHIIDARALARKLGKDPNTWKDLKVVLPLLSKKKYYKDLKYGYARGQEPVDYVEAIYEYHVILENEFKKEVKHEK